MNADVCFLVKALSELTAVSIIKFNV